MKVVTDTKEDMEEASQRSLSTKKSTRASQDEAVEEEEDTVEDTWSLDTSATTMTSLTTRKRITTIHSEMTRCTTSSLTEVTVSVLSEGELQKCYADISVDRHEQEEEAVEVEEYQVE